MQMLTPARAMGTAALLSILISGAAATAAAQTPTEPKPAMAHDMKDMKHKPAMAGMMDPHHVLAMAYRSNLATFGEALSSHAAHATTINLDLARPAVAEMRRSLEQMQTHHQAHKATMQASADSAMSKMIQHMDTHLASVAEHMTMLERDVAGSTPDPKSVSLHTAAILKEHAGMAKPPAAAAPHKM